MGLEGVCPGGCLPSLSFLGRGCLPGGVCLGGVCLVCLTCPLDDWVAKLAVIASNGLLGEKVTIVVHKTLPNTT